MIRHSRKNQYHKLLCAFGACLLGRATLVAGPGSTAYVPDLEQVAVEATKSWTGEGELYSITWFPEEFWDLSFRQQPQYNAQVAEEFLKVLRPYTVFAVAATNKDSAGKISFLTEDTLLDSIRLFDAKGKKLPPLAPAEIDDRVKGLFALMKPFMSVANKELGENMHFVFFPGADEKGRRLADPLQAGELKVGLAENEIRWRLPLGAFFPPRRCRVCKEMFTGAFLFCPYDGQKLSEKAP